MRFAPYLVLAFAAVACVAQPSQQEEVSAVSLDDWHREEIAMPPQFAPDLPAGEEVLMFAPGMFDPEDDGFWSYVFLMRVEESDLSEARILEIFELYYDGLLETVAADRNEHVGHDPAQVSLQSLGQGVYRLEISLMETFVTMESLLLHVWLEVQESEGAATELRVKASPQAEGHMIWEQLEVALKALSF